MKTRTPKPMNSVLADTVRQLGIGPKLKQYEMFERWPSIVGKQIAKTAQPLRIEKGRLFVRVTQSAWRNELVFLKQEIIEKINTAMNQVIVKDIIFR